MTGLADLALSIFNSSKKTYRQILPTNRTKMSRERAIQWMMFLDLQGSDMGFNLLEGLTIEDFIESFCENDNGELREIYIMKTNFDPSGD